MFKSTIFAILTVLISISAQDCNKYKRQVDSLMVEFNTIKDKMCNPGLSRDEYDDLNSIYIATWSEVVDIQKEQKKCIESQKKTVKVKVEPKRVDSILPQVLDIKWSSTRQKIKEALKNKKELKISETDEGILEYKGGKFLEYKVEKWQFNFVDKKLYACQIVLQNDPKLSVFKLYENVSKSLKGKYGEPGYEKNKFPPSYKDDKIKLSAVKNGSVIIYNKWLFKKDDIVRVGINENGSVLVTYLVDDLFKKIK